MPVPQPVEYTAPVALEGAAIVEFFDIPLEGAQDLVFVLDRSGSMTEYALGQIVTLASPQPLNGQTIPVEPPLGTPPPPPQPTTSPEAQAVEALVEAWRPRKIDVAHAELVHALVRSASWHTD